MTPDHPLPTPHAGAVLHELVTQARQTDETGARSLVALCEQEAGWEEAKAFVAGLMKAFCCCAFSLGADDAAGAKALAKARDAHPGLAWAQAAYRQDVALEELNSELGADAGARERGEQRLAQWLDGSAC